MCLTEAVGHDLSLMKRLYEETGSPPLCRSGILSMLMSLETPGTTYHPLTTSSRLIVLLHCRHPFCIFVFIFVWSVALSFCFSLLILSGFVLFFCFFLQVFFLHFDCVFFFLLMQVLNIPTCKSKCTCRFCSNKELQFLLHFSWFSWNICIC